MSYRSRLYVRALEPRIAPAVTEFLDPNPAPGNGFGSSVVALSTGNVAIGVPFDDAGGTDAGAVYLFNGATGTLISTLLGGQANDNIGGTITGLTNGNYVVVSAAWDNGAINSAGAVTWCNGTTGLSGVVSSANSLIGSTSFDMSGTGVIVLTNGNYVVRSPNWNNGAIENAGAVTWCNGATGTTGVIGIANSLVGSTGQDSIGIYGTALTNGNYVVASRVWDNGSAFDAGAVTWGNGTIAVTGAVSGANSLVGSKSSDYVGGDNSVHIINALANGNYVVRSRHCDIGAIVNAGAMTWANGSTGITGAVTAVNSLYSAKSHDSIGSNFTELTNGNFVLGSVNWDNGAATDAGAATWVNGTTGLTGTISAANSLVGSTTADNVGSFVTALTNGNYVVCTSSWDNGAVTNLGAATWANGATGIKGTITAANSLIGAKTGDNVGFAYALTNGNYIVCSANWDNGAAANVGAVTWCDGTAGSTGVVTAANSLIGSTANDQVGGGIPTALTNGNYVVVSPNWDNGAVTNVGAATWGNGTTGTIGVVSAANSIVGSTSNDNVGLTPAVALKNGNYAVSSIFWDNGAVTNAGAVTWGNGSTGTTGTVSSANSLVGSKASDQVGSGSITIFSNGNYAVVSPFCDNGAILDAGAVTWGKGTTGIAGVVTTANSVMGSVNFSSLQDAAVIDNVNGTFFGRFINDTGGKVRGGYQASGLSAPPQTVTSVVFGDGTNQRSTVRQIVVTFSETVNFAGGVASAFTLNRTGTGGTLGNVTLAANPATGTASTVTLTFSGSLTELGSLVDGRYDFTINATKVSGSGGALDGDNDNIPGGNYLVTGTTANKFFRFFGDANGDGTAAANDFIAFRLALGGTSAIFDFDGDGAVAASDFIQFRLRFGGSV